MSAAVAPLLGMCSASKHAVKGFTDALGVEIEQLDRAPVSITLILQSAVNTQHARNDMDQEPEAILRAATHRTQTKKVGLMANVEIFVTKVPRHCRTSCQIASRIRCTMTKDRLIPPAL